LPGIIHNHMVVDSLTVTFGAFADPTRRSLLRRLARGPAPVGALARPYRISQQAVSKHLALLERAGLIAKRREGRRHLCVLRARRFEEAAVWVEGHRRLWERRLDRLDAYLKELHENEKEHDPKA